MAGTASFSQCSTIANQIFEIPSEFGLVPKGGDMTLICIKKCA